jgi:predicted AlkP superfamily phosphohydrolase/phosphomutase
MGIGCAEKTADSPPIVVIGFDSADWIWIDQLAESGRMPNFVAMQERGVRADLRSLVPPQKSPTIWTSIATGKRPAKHGIADFIARKEKVQTSELRQSAAYWDVLGGLGYEQAVLGWWVTFPATPIQGVLVSDFLPYLEEGSADNDRAVYPPELWPTVDSLRVRPSEIVLEELGRFADLDIAREHGDAAWTLLARLREFLANDRTYLANARHLYGSTDYQCFTLYFRGLDMVSHEYWKYFQPRVSGLKEDDWRVRMLGEVVPNYYEYVDELLGEVLSFVEEDSRVMVVSDHGFFGHRRSSNGLSVGVGMHREHGILLMQGPGLRQGARIERAEVKDIMPTILVMSGVPIANDLDGHVLGEAFEAKVQRSFDRLLTDAIDSYDGLRRRGDGAGGVSDETNAAVLEQLRSLGYIE